MREHVFYHADRNASLKEYQELNLDENGLSKFERACIPAFKKPFQKTLTRNDCPRTKGVSIRYHQMPTAI
jgi:hypothetical protein